MEIPTIKRPLTAGRSAQLQQAWSDLDEAARRELREQLQAVDQRITEDLGEWRCATTKDVGEGFELQAEKIIASDLVERLKRSK